MITWLPYTSGVSGNDQEAATGFLKVPDSSIRINLPECISQSPHQPDFTREGSAREGMRHVTWSFPRDHLGRLGGDRRGGAACDKGSRGGRGPRRGRGGRCHWRDGARRVDGCGGGARLESRQPSLESRADGRVREIRPCDDGRTERSGAYGAVAPCRVLACGQTAARGVAPLGPVHCAGRGPPPSG